MSILFRRIYWATDEGGGGAPPLRDPDTGKAAAQLAAEAAAMEDLDKQGQKLLRTYEKLHSEKIRDIEASKLSAEQKQKAHEANNKELESLKKAHRERVLETDEIKRNVAQREEALRIMIEEGKASEEDLKNIKARIDAYKDAAEAGEDLAQALLGVGDAAKRNEKLAKMFTKSGLKGMADGFKKNLKPANLIDSAFTSLAIKTFELAMAQDKAISSFRKGTGASKQYNLEIAQLERSTFAAGVTVEDAANAYTDLYTSFNTFTELNSAERKKIGETVTLIEKMGVSSADSAKILNSATKSLGMNATESEALLRDIVSTAQTVGRSVSEVSADFISASSKLAFHGDKLTGIFQKLQMQAKSTGLEMDTLLSFAAQFDTFEGAGRAVGRLNAIMGGPYLNSIDMLNATEEERIEIMQRSMKMAGLSFDQMSKYEQLAIADAMGVSAEEARKMFGTVTAEMEIQRLKEEELAAQAAEMQDMVNQLRSAFMALAENMRPLIEDHIKPLFNWLSKISQMGDGLGGKIMFWGGAFVYVAAKLKLLLPLIKAMNINLGMTATILAPIVAGFMAFQFFSKHMAPLPAILLSIAAAAAVLAVALAFATAGTSAAAAMPWVAGLAAVLAVMGIASIPMTGGLKSGEEKEGKKDSSAAGRFSSQATQAFNTGGTVRGTPGTIQPTQYSEGGRAEFGITPAGTTFADAQTVNSLIKALEDNTKARERDQKSAGGAGGTPTVVLQMGNKQIEFDKAVVDAAWKSRSAKQTVGALQ